jgi:membrane-bound metal-dependent hydrolase YbcI (DUF457 family)
MPIGWDVYLRVHEIGTHTVIGWLGCALLAAGAVKLFARRSEFALLCLAAWLGAASHVLLDLLSSARARPGWPATDAEVSIPIVAMADPWLLALCSAGPLSLWLTKGDRRRTARIALCRHHSAHGGGRRHWCHCLHALVRRGVRRSGPRAAGDHQDWRLHADAAPRGRSTNNTFANGVPSPVA